MKAPHPRISGFLFKLNISFALHLMRCTVRKLKLIYLIMLVQLRSAMESTMRFVGARAYGTCLLATLCCSPADAMMQYFYKASLKEGYDGIEWPENVMDNAFFDKSFDIWSIFTIVRACAALVGWFVTGFGLYRRGINVRSLHFII